MHEEVYIHHQASEQYGKRTSTLHRMEGYIDVCCEEVLLLYVGTFQSVSIEKLATCEGAFVNRVCVCHIMTLYISHYNQHSKYSKLCKAVV